MTDDQGILFSEKPSLRRPFMICGIGGWVDGGQAATGTVEYLIDKLSAQEFAEIPIEDFHVFQVPGQISMRPRVKIEDGVIKEHEFPENLFFYWVNPASDHDLILFLGTEPSLDWEGYAESILQLVSDFDVPRIYLLGGVLDKTPHTMEPNVSCACSLPELKEEMINYGVQFSNYEGPGRFGTTLLYICQQRQIEMVSLTTRATYYPEFSVVVSRNPKSIRALTKRLSGLVQLDLDTSDLDAEVEQFEAKLGEMAVRSAEFRSYLEKLEGDYVELTYQRPLEISGDEAVRIAEDLLRRNAKQ